MTANLIWSIVLAAVGILGLYMAGSKNIWGWAISFGAQALWIVFAVVTAQYGFILSALAYGFVYGRNFIKWRREKKSADILKYDKDRIIRLIKDNDEQLAKWIKQRQPDFVNRQINKVSAFGDKEPDITNVDDIPRPNS